MRPRSFTIVPARGGWAGLLAVCLATCFAVGSPAVGRAVPVSTADREIILDRPVALWRFEEAAGSKQVVADSVPPDTAADTDEPTVVPRRTDVIGTAMLGEPGPRPPRHPTADAANGAALLGDGRGFFRLADALDLRFGAGDSITLEAWVHPFAVSDGQQAVIVGKGRTGRPEVAKDNQNWALRLTGVRGAAAVSFLFRTAADPAPEAAPTTSEGTEAGPAGAFHRWTSTDVFEPDSGWHHVAVTYTFGSPDSIRGFIDGRPVAGAWDLGGATSRPPVMDEDEVWIGSSLGGAAASTFPGLLDSVAVHRRVLSPERIAARWHVDDRISAVPDVALAPVPEDAVLFEVIEGVPDGTGWSYAPREPTERFSREFFAMTALPMRFDGAGVRADRTNPFVVRARSLVHLPEGRQRITVRTRGAARIFLDGEKVAELKAPGQRTDGHEKMFQPDRTGPTGMRIVQPGDQQAVVDVDGDGGRHTLHVEVRVGGRGRRPETGEFSASIGPPDGVPTVVQAMGRGSTGDRMPLSDEGWGRLVARLDAEREAVDTAARRAAAAGQDEYWRRRHAAARDFVLASPGPIVPEIPASHAAYAAAVHNEIDRFVNARLIEQGVAPAALIDDAAFARRLSLDVRGIVPEAAEVEAFIADRRSDRRARLVDTWLADPRWADHWVGYWQDVLAENPNLVNPTLNNTGPFRFWIHDSFVDRKPIDRMVTELVMMEGSTHFGGPAGFALATENDAPFAAKAHVLARAFLGMEMNCARCHDAPNHPFLQQDLFGLAAMLKRGPQRVPATSSVPGDPARLASLAISITLQPGTDVAPMWPFDDLVAREAVWGEIRQPDDTREELAALITSPANRRFARVVVNRLWERLMGRGLVANADDWSGGDPNDAALLDWLARDLVLHDHALEHVARVILMSHTYGRSSAAPPEAFAGRLPRRMSAEQIVDSLAVASGKPFDTEPMNIDIDTSRQTDKSLNLGQPTRAWQFTALGNERDRPSLSLPFAQHYVTLMEAFGWRGERQAPVTHRDAEPTALQPAVLANGVVVKRAAQLSDGSAFTHLALRDLPLDGFIDGVFRRILSRGPTDAERGLARGLLEEGYDGRRSTVDHAPVVPPEERPLGVTWSNHLSEEANIAKQRLAEIAARGDPPTRALDPEWRERAEDFVWALFNMPEFVFVP